MIVGMSNCWGRSVGFLDGGEAGGEWGLGDGTYAVWKDGMGAGAGAECCNLVMGRWGLRRWIWMFGLDGWIGWWEEVGWRGEMGFR